MKTQHYELSLAGLPEAKGEIKAEDLLKVLKALLKTTERATRLMALGEGSSTGTRPAWLSASLEVTVKKLKEGSTILALEAPLLSETAYDQFAQNEFWRSTPAPEDTALDLAAYAIQEATSENETTDRLDASVIEAALEFRKVAKESNIIYTFTPKGTSKGAFQLKETDYEKIAARKAQIPESKAFIVSGKLDVIQHTKGQFTLELINGQKLLGRIDIEFLAQQDLRQFWGKEVTVEGMVLFKPSGAPQIIHARKLTAKAEGDELFEHLPEARSSVRQEELFPEAAQAASKADPMALWGLWEGDESIDELLTQIN